VAWDQPRDATGIAPARFSGKKARRKRPLLRLFVAYMRSTLSLMTITSRRCARCGRALGLLARPDRLYCSDVCRVRGNRLRHTTAKPVDLEQLVDAVQPALAETSLLVGIAIAARDDWRAAAFVLERRYPQRWGALSRRVERGDGEADLDHSDWLDSA
jgi:hypothetical protein